MFCASVKMFYVLVLWPVLLASAVLTLTIDSILGTSIEDCFERIAIGEQLPSSTIYRNVSELTTKECEQICKQDKQCQAYDYGVGAKGNSTCDLSNINEKQIKEDKPLLRNPDYDVYVRRIQCEQSPPTPLDQEILENGPLHRPIVRPDEDAKRPLADDYEDSRPYPDRRPSYNERPDSFDSSSPDDRPPSYGVHTPSNIPYNEKPFRPGYDSHRRPRPNFRPDPYGGPSEEIHDIYAPKPEYIPERPQYQYIIRPNRKPKPDSSINNGYNQANSRPDYDRPSYSYNSQYASNYGGQDNSIHVEIYDPPRYKPVKRPYDQSPTSYGQNYGYNQYQESSSQFGSGQDSYSKPSNRPETTGYGHESYSKPERPVNGYGFSTTKPQQSQDSSQYGQSSYASGNKYTYDQSQQYGQSSQYGQSYGTGNKISGQSQYGQSDHKYGQSHNQNGYGISHTSDNDYGRPSYSRPSYGNEGYNTQSSNSQYSSHSQENSQSSSYGQSHSTLSSHGSSNIYGSDGHSYGQSNKPSSYGESNNYGSGYNQASHGYNQNSQTFAQTNKYDTNKRPYNEPSYDQNSLFGSHLGYGTHHLYDIYGHKIPNQDRPYNDGPHKPSVTGYHETPVTGYGETGYQSGNKPTNGYGYDTKPNDGFIQAGYGKPTNHHETGYEAKPGYSGSNYETKPNDGYGKPDYVKPSGYTPGYGSKPNGYSETSYETKPSSGYGGASYQKPKPSGYGGSYQEPNQSGYGASYQEPNQSGYGGSGLEEPKPNGYGGSHTTKPTNSYTESYETQPQGYGANEGAKPGYNQTIGYGLDRPDVKPVYEFEFEKPDAPSYILQPDGSIITTRPISVGDYEKPGYGRNPDSGISYKACFRRVLAGRRALRSHVRRVVDCERLEDCRRECATERRFHCESFNYRLDPSFRGKGLCELMTKPIEAFDIKRDFVDDKDYDFYELDRNSLEPNCPETLRGPGLLHSGFLSSKPKGSERIDWYDASYRGHNRYDEKQHYTHHKRYEDQFYVPYQIGVSRSDDQENWGQYGGHYGNYGTYYKNQNDFRKSYSHWGLSDSNRYYGVKHGTNTDFDYHSLGKGHDNRYGYGSWKRGRWNSSGESWSRWDEIGRVDDSDDGVKDCSSRRSAGMSLRSGAVRRSLSARSVIDCEAACFGETEFKCVSYSYRYSSPSSDNCFLSERPYKALEMSADSGSDVYAMPQHLGCHTVSTKPWVESECFWHVRSGSAVSGTALKAALTVTGLGACEAECIRAHKFFCRGFSFRFEPPTIGDDLENCILTSSPPTSLEGGRGLRPTSGHELYARGNYGRGCEPALYDDVQHKDAQCYLQYDNSAKLTSSAVRGQARVRDDRACGKACTDAPFRCLSFSYNANSPPDVENCLLSEIRLFDLQRGVDYVHSGDDLLFAYDLFNGQCWRKVYGQHEVPTSEIPHPLTHTIEEHYPANRPDPPSAPESYITGPSGPRYPTGPESSKPIEPGYKPSYEPAHGYLPDSGPSGPIGLSGPIGPTGPIKPEPEYVRPIGPIRPEPEYVRPIGPIRPEPEPIRPIGPSGPIRPIGPTGPIESSGPTGPLRPYPDFDYKPSYFKPVPEPYKPIHTPYKPSSFESGYRPNNEYKPGYLPEKPGYRPIEKPYVKPSRPNLVGGGNEITSSSWRHYTVSGFPCRKGTTCAQNHVAGHWACEPEGGEIGSWDYCCAPTHRCGYSEGFRKPWCYVGPAEDQWRPCSEKYYPYHQHKVPHPSLGHREAIRPRPDGPLRDQPSDRVRPGPYLPDADRKYWDDLYENGPQAYYDKYGNPLPGYTRVPTESRPPIKYSRNPPRAGSGHWVPVPQYDDEPQAAGLGVPRYWPVAYLHKEPPPNTTYFRFNEATTTTERYNSRTTTTEPDTHTNRPANDMESRSIEEHHRNEKRRNISQIDDDYFEIYNNLTTTYKPESTTTIESTTERELKLNNTDLESAKVENEKFEDYDFIKGIDGKLHDFTTSLEVFDIEDATTGDKLADIKTLEAEEKQIEAIGRLLASKRGGKLILDRQKQELQSKNVAVDNDFMNFNIKNRFPTERRGIVQRVAKEELRKDVLNEGSLEVSETTFVRPPRILSTTESVKKAIVNGKVFYDATIRDRKELFTNSTRKGKSLRLEDRVPIVVTNSNAKKNVRQRNVNPVRRVKRVYRKRYNPEEVRKRLLEREKSKQADDKS